MIAQILILALAAQPTQIDPLPSQSYLRSIDAILLIDPATSNQAGKLFACLDKSTLFSQLDASDFEYMEENGLLRIWHKSFFDLQGGRDKVSKLNRLLDNGKIDGRIVRMDDVWSLISTSHETLWNQFGVELSDELKGESCAIGLMRSYTLVSPEGESVVVNVSDSSPTEDQRYKGVRRNKPSSNAEKKTPLFGKGLRFGWTIIDTKKPVNSTESIQKQFEFLQYLSSTNATLEKEYWSSYKKCLEKLRGEIGHQSHIPEQGLPIEDLNPKELASVELLLKQKMKNPTLNMAGWKIQSVNEVPTVRLKIDMGASAGGHTWILTNSRIDQPVPQTVNSTSPP